MARCLALVVLAAIVAGPGIALAGAAGPSADGCESASTPVENASSVAETGAEQRSLVVAVADSGEPLFEVPVADGDEVVLTYTHSVEKTPVEDVYVVESDELRMDRTVFRSFGAGLPSTADATRTDDGFVVDVNRSYERLYVSPGSIAGHALVVGDRCYDLVERSGGSTVVVSVDDRPAADSDRVHGGEDGQDGGECE